jgi:hypothetical protein
MVRPALVLFVLDKPPDRRATSVVGGVLSLRSLPESSRGFIMTSAKAPGEV